MYLAFGLMAVIIGIRNVIFAMEVDHEHKVHKTLFEILFISKKKHGDNSIFKVMFETSNVR